MDVMVEKTPKTNRVDAKKRGTDIDDLVLEEEERELSCQHSLMEEDMNANDLLRPAIASHPVFHKFPALCISTCKHCGKRLLNFRDDAHYNEYHSGATSNELDDTVLARMEVEDVAL